MLNNSNHHRLHTSVCGAVGLLHDDCDTQPTNCGADKPVSHPSLSILAVQALHRLWQTNPSLPNEQCVGLVGLKKVSRVFVVVGGGGGGGVFVRSLVLLAGALCLVVCVCLCCVRVCVVVARVRATCICLLFASFVRSFVWTAATNPAHTQLSKATTTTRSTFSNTADSRHHG